MTNLLLKELDATNFRSLRGHVHAPLDARVVLVHGENGAGKTSLLSAIELALTGSVQSLQRADPAYEKQLLHRSAETGSVVVATGGDAARQYRATFRNQGIDRVETLDPPLASFFSERSYLPQSLLNQLLQIYQEAGSGADSPLAKFVGELLGLDRLDAIEAGLKPLVDVRNVRKISDDWSTAEIERARLEALIKDQKSVRAELAEAVARDLADLSAASVSLELGLEVDEQQMDEASAAFDGDAEELALGILADQRRRLGSIQREIIEVVPSGDRAAMTATVPGPAVEAGFVMWQNAHASRYEALRRWIDNLLPHVALPDDMARFVETVPPMLAAECAMAAQGARKARSEADRIAVAHEEQGLANSRLSAIDEEISRVPTTAGGLAAILSELTSYIDGEICPVCDRDYAEQPGGSLVGHVHTKVRTHSESAERLITLGRSRGEALSLSERLRLEIATLGGNLITPKALADLDRKAAELEAALGEVSVFADILLDGARLRDADVAARRGSMEARARSVSLTAARQTISVFAASLDAMPLQEGEEIESAGRRLEERLSIEASRIERRLTAKRFGREAIARMRSALERRAGIDRQISEHETSYRYVTEALQRAQKLRERGLAIRSAVDDIRSSIIRREFNDRLNRLWRDLFVRLVPNEPFIPAFRIPASSTQRLQPKLVTEHREGGDAGGTPGAMLSAGNLNTAALTLFLALHLSVSKTLPWLILDDPVQSMDDVHIAHLAALLRTLSKEHGRQVVIAVHDRQLFDYLRLELSPAFPGDSLLTLELSRGPNRDTRCLSKRFGFQEETALLAA